MGDTGLDALGAQSEHQPLVAELALAPGDPLVLGELREIHLPPPREPVTDRQRDIGRVVQDGRLGQAVGDRYRLVVPIEDHGEIEVAADHPGDAAFRFQLA